MRRIRMNMKAYIRNYWAKVRKNFLWASAITLPINQYLIKKWSVQYSIGQQVEVIEKSKSDLRKDHDVMYYDKSILNRSRCVQICKISIILCKK